MFILSEDTADQGYNFEETGMVGDAEELAEIGVELTEAYSGLQMAFVRMEARAIREQASEGTLSEDTQSLMEAGAKDFFKRVTDAIKRYWNKLIDVLKKVAAKIAAYFSGQEKFIRKNRDALRGITDQQLKEKEVKFDRTNVIENPSVLKDIVEKGAAGAEKALSDIESEKTLKADKFKDQLVSVMGITGEAAKKDTVSAVINEAINGVAKEKADMTTKDIANAISIIQEGKGVEKTLRVAQTTASSTIKMAESRARMGISGDDKESSEEASKTLANIKTMSSRVGGALSSIVNANQKAGKLAKSTLMRAMSAAGSKDESKQEDGIASVLDQYFA